MKKRSSALLATTFLALYGIGNAVLHLGTPRDWWFEDDPGLYMAIRRVASPLDFFWSLEATRTVAGPNELAPVLGASFWLDQAVAPREPAFAYAHSIALYVLTGLALFFACRRFLGGTAVALATSLIWMSLPSTAVMLEFLSTRHYLIGMLFSLLALLSMDKALTSSQPRRRAAWGAAFVLTGAVAVISKEFYPTALLTAAFCMAAYRRAYGACVASVALGAGYLAYRLAMTTAEVSYYDIPLLSAPELAVALGRLPYMLFGGDGSYPLLLVAASVLAWRARADRTLRAKTVWLLAVLFVSLVTIYPVAQALFHTWRSFGTWYRTPFVVNTTLLLLIALAWTQVRHRYARGALFAITAVAAIEGMHKTANKWDRMKAEQAAEGRFLLERPSELLFSRHGALWFLNGVKGLYDDRPTAAFVSVMHPKGDAWRKKILSFPVLWHYKDGEVRPMPPEDRTAVARGERAAE